MSPTKRLANFGASSLGGWALGMLFILLTAWAWVGFLGSDDVTYSWGAYGWLEEFPYVGGHGTIRYPITIPMALSFMTFGENEYAMVLPSYLAMLGIFFLFWRTIRKIASTAAANFSLLLAVTMPLLVVQTTIASVDIVEGFFLFASFLLLWKYLHGDHRRSLLFFAGVTAGLAFLTRETAIFVAVFYAVLFLSAYRINRWQYLWVAAGFLSMWLVELVYLWIMTGDPLYRLNISMNHDSSIDRSIDVAGNLIIHPAIDPLLVLLFNQEFMMLFWFGIPLAIWFCFYPKCDAVARQFARLLTLFGLTWFICAGAAVTLLPLNPRYFMITAITIALVAGLALHHIWTRSSRKWLLTGLIILVLASNWLGIFAENKDILFGERQLAEVAAERQEVIFTDPTTRYRADTLLRWERKRNSVVGGVPDSGKLYYYNPGRVDTVNDRMDETLQNQLRPQAGWETLGMYQPDPGFIIRTVEAVGADKLVPGSIWTKLRYRHPETTLYRVTNATE